MVRFFLIAGALFVISSFSASAHLDGYAVFVLPAPVAIYAARGRMNQALGLILISAFAGATRGIQGFMMYALIAGAGMPIAIGVVRRWTYGRTVATVATIAAIAVIGGILASWQQWLDLSRAGFDAFAPQYGKQAPTQIYEAMQWGRDHWADIGVGMQFAIVLTASITTVWAALAVLRRRYAITGVRGTFRTTRASEWLVWVAIAVALMWFADRTWPGIGLRAVAWNSAIALAVVYWFNGLSIMWYGLDVLRPGMMGYLGAALLLVSFGLYPVCMIGLFDTWVNFRNLADRFVEERKRREQAEQTDDK